VLAPVTLVPLIGVPLFFVIGGCASPGSLTVFFYHYQRQNFGLISFASTNVGAGRLPPQVSTALNLAALGGYVSMLGVCPGIC
jgi:hypothetical protein